MNERELALKVAWRYVGTPYIWGGDDPSGFDCSGLVVEVLKSVGRMPVADASAEMLRQIFPPTTQPKPADLVFWLRNGRAFHVGMLIEDPAYYIGADGGGSATQSVADAWRTNAFVKVRPVAGRGSEAFRAYGSPFGA